MDRKQELKEEIKTLQRELSAIYKAERAKPYFNEYESWLSFSEKLRKLNGSMNMTGRIKTDETGSVVFDLLIDNNSFEFEGIPKLAEKDDTGN